MSLVNNSTWSTCSTNFHPSPTGPYGGLGSDSSTFWVRKVIQGVRGEQGEENKKKEERKGPYKIAGNSILGEVGHQFPTLLHDIHV